MSLTAKGVFALSLIEKGISPSLNEIDALWADIKKDPNHETICPRCNGKGYVRPVLTEVDSGELET